MRYGIDSKFIEYMRLYIFQCTSNLVYDLHPRASNDQFAFCMLVRWSHYSYKNVTLSKNILNSNQNIEYRTETIRYRLDSKSVGLDFDFIFFNARQIQLSNASSNLNGRFLSVSCLLSIHKSQRRGIMQTHSVWGQNWKPWE